MKLFELTEQYQKVLAMVDDETDMQAIQDTLEGLQGEITDKAESIAKLMKSIEADEQAIKAEEERLCARREALENRRLSIKGYLENQLIGANIDKVKGTMFTVAIQNNPPSVQIDNEDSLKKETGMRFYVEQEPKLDKKALSEALKNGEEYSFCRLVQTRGLRIK